MNPLRAHSPRLYRGVSEHKRDVLFFLRIEDSPQLAGENLQLMNGGVTDFPSARRHNSREFWRERFG